MQDESTICIATFSSELVADIARMTLETNGIDCFVVKDDCGGMRPYMQLATGVRLIVRESEANRASEILNEIKGLNE